MGILMKLIQTLNDNLGLTSIIVSHDVREAASIADYIYIVANGRVMEQGTADTLQQAPSAWAQQFLQGLPDGPVKFHYPAAPYLEDLFAG